MRHPAAYYLLLLYCTVLMRCAIPVACDALSHLFDEEEHLATIHALYGSHHLQAEVAGAATENHADQHTTLQQSEPNAEHTMTQAFQPIINCIIIFSEYPHFFLSAICHVAPDNIGKPPKIC